MLASVLEGLDGAYQDVRFTYSLWYQSPYKGPPIPRVEEAWHDIIKCDPMNLPRSLSNISLIIILDAQISVQRTPYFA